MGRQLHTILVVAGLLQLAGSAHSAEASLQVRISEEQTHLAKLRSLVSASPQAARDDYARLGIAVAEHFVARMKTGGPDGKQTDDWTSLQIDEVGRVLADTELRIRQIIAGEAKPLAAPKPTNGPVTIRDGVFYADTQTGWDPGYPYYMTASWAIHKGGVVKF